MHSPCETSDLLVFSHLRWDFVFGRPQHLLSRFAKHRRVYYIEDAIFGVTKEARLHIRVTHEYVKVVVPYLPEGFDERTTNTSIKMLLEELMQEENIQEFTSLYYNPKALDYSRQLKPAMVLFDCIENHENTDGNEEELFKKAHLVFTNSKTMFDAKKPFHENIYPFPNSVDYNHFSQARMSLVEPDDQMNIPHPRIGFYGVIDQRFNFTLLKKMSELRPEFHFVLVGPVIGIEQSDLPKSANIHYLSKKDYHALPLYLSSWDCTFIPYHVDETTRFTSPSKIPEFLAAGKPLVATSLFNVIHPYADAKLVYVADHPEHFVECIEKSINESIYDPEWLERVDQFLDGNSWDATFRQMAALELHNRIIKNRIPLPAYMDQDLISIGIV